MSLVNWGWYFQMKEMFVMDVTFSFCPTCIRSLWLSADEGTPDMTHSYVHVLAKKA